MNRTLARSVPNCRFYGYMLSRLTENRLPWMRRLVTDLGKVKQLLSFAANRFQPVEGRLLYDESQYVVDR
jgi:hypothetical protein